MEPNASSTGTGTGTGTGTSTKPKAPKAAAGSTAKTKAPKKPTLEWNAEHDAALTAIMASGAVRTAKAATELILAHPAFEAVKSRINVNKVRGRAKKLRLGLQKATGIELPEFSSTGRYTPDWSSLAAIVSAKTEGQEGEGDGSEDVGL